jgi:hypothetical protein
MKLGALKEELEKRQIVIDNLTKKKKELEGSTRQNDMLFVFSFDHIL